MTLRERIARVRDKIATRRNAWEQSAPGSSERAANRRAIVKLKAIRATLQRKIDRRAWGGSKLVCEDIVLPILAKHGIPVTSLKRWETFGNPGSDHYKGNKTAYAVDGATDSNYAVAQEIRSAFDGGTHVDYESFYFEHHGVTYRGQIIAGTHGTGPHLHTGVRRA